MNAFGVVRINHEMVLEFGSNMQRLKMYPYFDIAHYVLTISSLRDDLGSGFSVFSRRYPLNCWLWSILACFAGSFLTNFLLCEPLVAVFKRPEDLILATIIWYLVFYSPFDIFWRLTRFLPVKICLSLMKECQRVYKINHGVAYAARLYPNAYIIHALVGIAKGTGTGIIRLFDEFFLDETWLPASTAARSDGELNRLSFTTKAAIICAVLLTADKSGCISFCPHEIVYLVILLFLVYFKLSALLLDVIDPLAPFENIFCAIFMGGIWDALSKAIETSMERRSADSTKLSAGASVGGEPNGHQHQLSPLPPHAIKKAQ